MLAPGDRFVVLIALAGLPASGKSSLARRLCSALPAVLLDKDAVRAFLFEDRVDYSRTQNDLCVDVIYDVANYLLTSEPAPHVVLDGRTYSRRYQIEALKQAAARSGMRLHIIECICSPASAEHRLEQGEPHLAKDRDFSLHLESRAAAEPIEEPRLIIDTDAHDPEQCLEIALRHLKSAT